MVKEKKKSLALQLKIYNENIEQLMNYLTKISLLKKDSEEQYYKSQNYGSLSFEKSNKQNDDNNWVDAYHGTGRNCTNEKEIKIMIESINKNGFRNGANNVHASCNDINHPGNKVGVGVYVTPNIKTAQKYAGIIHFEGNEYYTIFKVRVKKSVIRQCNCQNARDYWVVDGSPDQIIPNKILFYQELN